MPTDEAARCPHRPACDGCPAFEEPPAASYGAKVAAAHAAAQRYASHDWPAVSARPQGRTLAYRNRARLIVTEGRLGLYRAASRDVVPIERCAVHEPAVEAALARARTVLAGARHVDVRGSADGNTIVTFGFPEMPPEAQLAPLRAIADAALSVHVNVSQKQTYLAGEQTCLAGTETLTMPVGGQAFEVPPPAFFQVNTEVLVQIHDVVRPWIEGTGVLWDIHCGVGVHGIACAARGQTVRGFDIDPVGIEAARRNAAANGVSGTWEAASDETLDLGDGAGHAIVNPARAGLAWSLPQRLGGAQVGRVAYVSCDTRTFLRDAERLANEGFALRELHAFDMMPRTAHIELVGLFERAAAGRRWHALGDGVTGAPHGAGPDTWVALVAGSVPKRATLPGGQVTLERLRSVDDSSVVRLQSAQPLEATELRTALRRWKHPVLGDEQFGLRSANFRLRADLGLDVPALHRVRSGEQFAAVPDFLLSVFRLPRDLVQR